ncbi:MAG: HNH endonuclease [Candidatus Thorarchaeota archaeon]
MSLLPVLFRMCWNTKKWQKPSGDSREGSYLQMGEFGHEEWNFKTSDAVDGYIYAYVRRKPSASRIRQAKGRFLVGFYTRNPSSQKYELVGLYHDARIPTAENHEQLFQAFERRGIFKRRAKEVADLKAYFDYQGALKNLKTAVKNGEYVLKCHVENVHLLSHPIDVSHLIPEKARFMNPVYPTKIPLPIDSFIIVGEDEVLDRELEILDSVGQVSEDNMTQYLSARARSIKSPPKIQKAATAAYQVDVRQSIYLKRLAKDRCQICGIQKNKTLGYFCDTHHVTPLARGGHDSPGNILVVCPNCHRSIHREIITVKSRTKKQITLTSEGTDVSLSFIGVHR